MKWFWFRRRNKEDEFDKKYGDLIGRINAVNEELSPEQDEITLTTWPQQKQFVENQCEKIIESTRKIEETKKEYQLVNSYLTDIQIIESLPENGHKKVLELAKKVMVFERDRKEFGNSMTKMSNSHFNRIKECEDNIGEILKDLQDDENYCQRVKSDMNHLEAEKAALKYEKRAMKDRIYLVQGISKISLSAFIALMLLFLIVRFAAHKDMQIPVYALVGVAAVVGTVLFALYSSAVREIKLTELKMNKAIGLLNRIKLKYVNVQSRIDYLYQKFDIHSAYELNKMWAMYLKVCKEREVYHKASDKLIEAEDDLVKELAMYNVNDADIWISQASALVEDREMQDIKNSLLARRNRLRSSIDYNSEVIEKSGNAIKKLVTENKDRAEDIMNIVDSYQVS